MSYYDDKLTVGMLKEYLTGVIDNLACYDDNDVLRTVGNTYFIQSSYFMEYGSIGFVDLENIELDDDNDGDDDDYNGGE